MVNRKEKKDEPFSTNTIQKTKNTNPSNNTSSVVLQVWLACSPPEQKIVGSSHGPTHHRWCYRYG